MCRQNGFVLYSVISLMVLCSPHYKMPRYAFHSLCSVSFVHSSNRRMRSSHDNVNWSYHFTRYLNKVEAVQHVHITNIPVWFGLLGDYYITLHYITFFNVA